MTTFSQMVDNIVTETLRPDLRATIASYLNQTLRECNFKAGNSAPVYFDANRVETSEVTTADGTFVWTIPNAARFAAMDAIYISELGIYVKEKTPRTAFEIGLNSSDEYYWYRSGRDIAIAGLKSGWTIKFSYWLYPQPFAYVAASARTVIYNESTGEYETAVAGVGDGGTPTQAQLDSVTMWLLERWPDLLREGLRSKIWRRLADESRARMAYSAYNENKTMLWLGEPSSEVGV